MIFLNNLIRNYVSKLTREQVTSFALMHNIVLSNEELEFTYNFIKNNYENILNNYESLNLEQYKHYYTVDNFEKIKILFYEYSNKFKPFLK